MSADVEVTGWLDNKSLVFFFPAYALVWPLSDLIIGDEVEEGNFSRPAKKCAFSCSADATY